MKSRVYRSAAAALLVSLLASASAAQQAPPFVPLTAESANVEALRTPITASFADATIADAIGSIAKQAGLSLTYDPSLPGLDRRISVSLTRVAASRAILRVLED